MTTATVSSELSQDLLDQTVVVIGGSSGIGLETARLARAHGADVILAARDVGARTTAILDVTDLARVEQFFADLPEPIDRVVGPADVAALAVHLMTNTALTGATYDIDGGQQLLTNQGAKR